MNRCHKRQSKHYLRHIPLTRFKQENNCQILFTELFPCWKYRNKKITKWRIKNSIVACTTFLLCLGYSKILSLLNPSIDNTNLSRRYLNTSYSYIYGHDIPRISYIYKTEAKINIPSNYLLMS